MDSNIPKMSRKQAKLFWNNLTNEQKIEFNKLMKRLYKKELTLKNVMVDDNEQIQRIVLENKDAPSKPYEPFIKHFKI